ncbi:triose-phosphate isomerase [Pseudoalteromonas sp. MM17-2]|uniref:triose-phosphate isomerase n=1 Tax=unclassified Pseudoalteromonas TaxID=194690 RepID=UPI0006B5F769|nr:MULTISPECIES: triose-phosphate isomerase [unclassified Pseudoalteromonas]MCG7543042.1 triose-phosphate isomerase [Pseudoalteromonas sp. MM17-2]RZF80589.1 triose-phosphate isomerase [Pseudoalteromonas sp. CO325X]GAP74945.1 triosephosphate isomerase [Pseudoalteromonas sp. SW0106-04]
MASRKPLVAGNWKLNGSQTLLNEMANVLEDINSQEVDVALFVPALLAAEAVKLGLQTGVQTVSEYEAGAYTGETQAALAKQLGVTYTLVGHSERRHVFGESDEDVANKFAMAQQQGLIPVLCVGETEQQREQGETESVISAQIDAVIQKLGVAALSQSVIAYEPVWAIGTGKTASPQQAQDIHQFIRDKIAQQDQGLSQGLRILYGGSVNEKNSEELFAQQDIDGGLIGGASLKTGAFVSICESAKG